MRYYDSPDRYDEVYWDYDGRTDGQAVYVGFKQYQTNSDWLVYKFTYTSDFATHRQVAVGSWANRASLFT